MSDLGWGGELGWDSWVFIAAGERCNARPEVIKYDLPHVPQAFGAPVADHLRNFSKMDFQMRGGNTDEARLTEISTDDGRDSPSPDRIVSGQSKQRKGIGCLPASGPIAIYVFMNVQVGFEAFEARD
ncbi:hypothetical protein ACLOJK_033379 [Asimina triloba]